MGRRPGDGRRNDLPWPDRRSPDCGWAAPSPASGSRSGPVAEDVIEKTMAHLSPVVADMIRFQRLTGCRPGEVCQLRPMDLDRSADVWVYRPASHKTEHHGRDRVIFIGPKAQNLFARTCCGPPRVFASRPRNRNSSDGSRGTRHARRPCPAAIGRAPIARPGRSAGRKTISPRTPTTGPSSGAAKQAFGMPKNLRSVPGKLSPREQERLAKLPAKERQEAIENAERERKRLQGLAAEWRAKNCWSPNQLRHAAGTEVRRLFGLEAAQVILGHAKADVTQVYAERDMATAAEVMRKIG